MKIIDYIIITLTMFLLILLSFVVAKAEYKITSEVNKVAISQGADLLSTGIALTIIEDAIESNPLGWYLIPGKLVFTYGIMPYLNDAEQILTRKIITPITYGAVVNNVAIIAGASGSVPIIGGLITVVYLFGCNFDILPDTICFCGGYITGSISERLEKRIIRAEKENRTLTGFILSEDEARSLFREYEYCRDSMSFMGKTLEITI